MNFGGNIALFIIPECDLTFLKVMIPDDSILSCSSVCEIDPIITAQIITAEVFVDIYNTNFISSCPISWGGCEYIVESITIK